jgi:hypothetical protein
MAAALHGDVASAIGQQVEQMILQAQKDSETRVRHELSNARTQLQQMEAVINALTERVGTCARQNSAGPLDSSQTVDRAFLQTKIAALEQKWGSEVKALKQDLHRTILAHNHNSDLMRHHRDALDEARRKLDAQPKADQVDAQIEKVDRMLRAGQAKQRALDALTERLTALEHQVEILPSAQLPGAYPGMMPGMAGMGVPPGIGSDTAAPKGKAKKEELPSEDEIRARLSGVPATKLGQQASAETSFNAEAPVFVPRSTSSGDSLEGNASANAPMKLSAPAGLETGADNSEGEGEGTEAIEAEESAGEKEVQDVVQEAL